MKSGEKKKYVKAGSVGSYVSERRKSIERDRLWIDKRRKSRSELVSSINIRSLKDKSS